MTEEENKLWQVCQFRIEEEGFHYCFDGYSNWEEIKDPEFHRLRIQYLQSAKLLEDYVTSKADSLK